MPGSGVQGVQGFRDGLSAHGIPYEIISGVLVHEVHATHGPLAPRRVSVGVALDEVSPWPYAPPHWIHLPASVSFAHTNSDGSPLPGWLRHSRNVDPWGHLADPMAAWLAHVRGVLGGAA